MNRIKHWIVREMSAPPGEAFFMLVGFCWGAILMTMVSGL